ncbi:MAG: phosphoserine aminotransferase [Pseudomonadota bacterium]|jgi:phosphoserine aminotransferase
MRVYNFSAGPSALPLKVLERARDEIVDFGGCGMSIMEMSHRSETYEAVAQRAEVLLRKLFAVPKNYHVLFLQGGATAQFAAVPLNITGTHRRAAYVNTGIWSAKAIAEAGRYLDEVLIAASTEASGFNRVPEAGEWVDTGPVDYVHYTDNETIGGVEFSSIPASGDAPLVCDMSSNILSRVVDVSRYGLIYAGAQKNMGPSGITVVIVREDLLGAARPETPSFMNYAIQAKNGSMLNTPPTYPWYLLGLVLEWLDEQGGVKAMEALNSKKSALLYEALDNSDLFSNPVAVGSRSRMNIPFTLSRPELEALFLEEARQAGLVNLEGHRSVGGFRASLYNAMPYAGVSALVSFMSDFERRHG